MHRIDCPNCGKRLKHSDEHAGKTVKCPRCLSGILIPDPPPTSPPIPKTVSLPTSVVEPPLAQMLPWSEGLKPPAPPAFAPAPAPPLVVGWQQGLKPLPGSSAAPFDFEDSAPGNGTALEFDNEPASRRYGGGDEADESDDSEYHERVPVRRRPRWWAAFGAGCGLVKWGMWINFASSAYLILIAEVTLLGVSTKTKNLIVVDTIGLYFPLFLLQLTGTAMMLMGWWRMTTVPPNSGAVGLITGASALAALRELVLLVGTVFLLLAMSANGLDVFKYLTNAYVALMIANVCLWVATFSVIPGMAIIGGEIPSRQLRQKAGLITLVHQILAIIMLALVALVYFGVSAAELLPAGSGDEDRVATPRAGRGGGERSTRTADSDPVPLMMFFLLIVLAIEGAYTYLHYSLYAVGQQAAARGADRR
jgi:DNA-directed RNA polymerase subunit RPC12/RpoP